MRSPGMHSHRLALQCITGENGLHAARQRAMASATINIRRWGFRWGYAHVPYLWESCRPLPLSGLLLSSDERTISCCRWMDTRWTLGGASQCANSEARLLPVVSASRGGGRRESGCTIHPSKRTRNEVVGFVPESPPDGMSLQVARRSESLLL